ncbi:MAG: DUF1127 domain-containing protein [Gemmatimonadota bacterium]
MSTAGKAFARVARDSDAARTSATFGPIRHSHASTPATSEPRHERDGAPELDAWARRAQGANGFGGADVTRLPHSRDVPQSPARTDRAYGLAEIFVTFGAALASALRGMAARWRRQRDLRAAVHALRGLDARTLQDIGLTGSETWSTAAELVGAAEASRTRVLNTLRSVAL